MAYKLAPFSSLRRKMRRLERICFPESLRGLGCADSSSKVLAAFEGSQLVGYMTLDWDDGDVDVEVLDFCVHPKHTGCGLKLLLQFRDLCRQHGYVKVRAQLRFGVTDRLLRLFPHVVEGHDDETIHVVIML